MRVIMKQIKMMCAQTHLALIMCVCRSNRILIFCNSQFFLFLPQSNVRLSEDQRVYLFTAHTEHMQYY